MFTGIVEEVGLIAARLPGGLQIEAKTVLDGARVGDSISINGVCLTITRLQPGRFAVDTVPETLRRTNLVDLRAGDPVNLERAIAAGGRMGGHFVQGHIEGTGTVTAIEPDGEAALIHFSAEPEIMRYVVAKGFITVDGISLTVVSRTPSSFVITLIPFTKEHTNLGQRAPGDRVNLETDVLARYVESLFQPVLR
jgi:riboflavin synthase